MTTPSSTHRRIPGSVRSVVPGATRIADADATEQITVTVALRRRADGPPIPGHGDYTDRRIGTPPAATRDNFAATFGAADDDIAAVRHFAETSHLTVGDVNVAGRTVKLTGSIAAMNEAFQVDLGSYSGPDGDYRGREGDVHVPESLIGVVLGVFGLDTRQVAKPAFLRTESPTAPTLAPVRTAPVNAGVTASTVPLTPPQVAALYGFPGGGAAGQTIGLLQFGGGYRDADIAAFFGNLGVAVPSLTAVGVDGQTNSPGAAEDVEVVLDICVAAGAAPGAAVAVYFAPYTEQGWVDNVTAAVTDTTHRPSVISTSWGWTEDERFTDAAMDVVGNALADAAALGVTFLAASGDWGSDSGVGDGQPHVWYPGSDPWVTCCGGTEIANSSGSSFDEVVWDPTGGGVSNHFAKPDYQAWARVPARAGTSHIGRGVPDVAGNASPASGYNLFMNGSWIGAVGGTSAVAPLYAGLVAIFNRQLGEPIGFLNPVLYANGRTGVFRDITSGNNHTSSAPGYIAGPGWDACTGWGSIHGGLLLQALRSIGRPPALREYNGVLQLMWKGFERDDSLWISHLNGSAWSGQSNVPGMWSSIGPALAPFGADLYAAWKGAGTDQALWFSHFNGSSWAPQAVIPNTATSMGPQLETFNGNLYAAWKGAFDDQAIWYSHFNGATWSPQHRIPGVASSVGPCLAGYNGALYAAWKGLDNDQALYFSHFNGTSWAPQQTIPGWSTSGAALRAFNGRLYAAWKGMDGDQQIWWSSYDGISWSPQQPMAAWSSVGPALEVHGGRLYATWKGMLGDQSIWYSSFDGSTWSAQQQITSIGGTSPDL